MGWSSRDVVFFGIKDFSKGILGRPFLRSKVLTNKTNSAPRELSENLGDQTTVTQPRSHIRDPTLYNLAVMLIEIAYSSPLEGLQTSCDDQGDQYTLYWTATRLGDSVKRIMGPTYAKAVRTCLHGALAASSDLDETEVQERYFDEVVRRLAACVEAI